MQNQLDFYHKMNGLEGNSILRIDILSEGLTKMGIILENKAQSNLVIKNVLIRNKLVLRNNFP